MNTLRFTIISSDKDSKFKIQKVLERNRWRDNFSMFEKWTAVDYDYC